MQSHSMPLPLNNCAGIVNLSLIRSPHGNNCSETQRAFEFSVGIDSNCSALCNPELWPAKDITEYHEHLALKSVKLPSIDHVFSQAEHACFRCASIFLVVPL